MKQNKKSFALLVTIIVVSYFAYLSLNIIYTKTLSSNLDKQKYLYIQAKVHLDYIKKYIQTHLDNDINNFKLEDKRFDTNITKEDDINNTIYHIFINTNDYSHIRMYDYVKK